MKKLLLILVLFFSTSVFADDLTAKKIVCKNEKKTNSIQIRGFHFLSLTKLREYYASNVSPISSEEHKYLLSPDYIHIDSDRLHINRKSLLLKKFVFYDCYILDSNTLINAEISRLLKPYKDGNKI